MALTMLVAHIPAIIAWAIAIGLAIAHYDRQPLASLLVFVAAAISVFGYVAAAMLPSLYASGRREQMVLVSGALSLLSTGGLVCLIAAVFADRQRAQDRADPGIRPG